MARWKKTDVKVKAEIAKKRICEWKQSSTIAEELGVNERTVQRIIAKEVSEVVAESDIVQKMISDAMEASMLMWEISLNLAKNLKFKQRQEAEWAEWFAPTTDEIRTLNMTVESWFKRAQLLQNKPTENVWLVDWSEILRQIQSGNIGIDNAYDALRQSKE